MTDLHDYKLQRVLETAVASAIKSVSNEEVKATITSITKEWGWDMTAKPMTTIMLNISEDNGFGKDEQTQSWRLHDLKDNVIAEYGEVSQAIELRDELIRRLKNDLANATSIIKNNIGKSFSVGDVDIDMLNKFIETTKMTLMNDRSMYGIGSSKDTIRGNSL